YGAPPHKTNIGFAGTRRWSVVGDAWSQHPGTFVNDKKLIHDCRPPPQVVTSPATPIALLVSTKTKFFLTPVAQRAATRSVSIEQRQLFAFGQLEQLARGKNLLADTPPECRTVMQ